MTRQLTVRVLSDMRGPHDVDKLLDAVERMKFYWAKEILAERDEIEGTMSAAGALDINLQIIITALATGLNLPATSAQYEALVMLQQLEQSIRERATEVQT
jgi:hypothetical protein